MYEDKLELVRKIYEHQEGDGMILTAKDCTTLIMAVIPWITTQAVKEQIDREKNPAPETSVPGTNMGTMRVRLRATPLIEHPVNPPPSMSEAAVRQTLDRMTAQQEEAARRRLRQILEEEELSRLRLQDAERRARERYGRPPGLQGHQEV